MQNRKKTILWPVYFDSTKTRKEGRKVPKNIAIPNPTLIEIRMVADLLKLKAKSELDHAHSAKPWLKTGRIIVEKQTKKSDVCLRIAKQLTLIRKSQKTDTNSIS